MEVLPEFQRRRRLAQERQVRAKDDRVVKDERRECPSLRTVSENIQNRQHVKWAFVNSNIINQIIITSRPTELDNAIAGRRRRLVLAVNETIAFSSSPPPIPGTPDP